LSFDFAVLLFASGGASRMPVAFETTIPKALRSELERTNLLERLHSSEASLICLIAPSGFGKTTLLAQHARSSGERTVWLSLTEDDCDAAALALAMRDAIQTVMPKLELKTLDSAGPETDSLAVGLARALDQARENLTLILDGADVLSPEAGKWLERFLNALQEGHRVILSAHSEPNLRVAQLAAQGRALMIGLEDLAFSGDEARAYLHSRQYAGDAPGVFASLEGWPAGLALVASGANPHVTPESLVLEVLDRLPPAVRAAIPEAAVLEVWTEGKAKVLGCDLPTGWLRQVRRAGLPLTPLGGGAQRPHATLLWALERELSERAKRHAELHSAAGRQAHSDGDGMRAMRHYLSAGTNEQALEVANQLRSRFQSRGEHKLVRQVLEAFQGERLSSPLRCAHALALIETGEAARGEAILHGLLAAGQESSAVHAALGLLAGRLAQRAQQLEHAGRALELASNDPERLVALRLQASALDNLSRHQEALEVLAQAMRLSEAGHDLSELAQTLQMKHYVLFGLGEFTKCEPILHRCIEIFTSLDMPTRALDIYNELAELRRIQGRGQEALAILEVAIPNARRESSPALSLLLETRGDVHLWNAEFGAAVEAYSEALAQTGPFKLEAHTLRLWAEISEALARSGDGIGAYSALKHMRSLGKLESPVLESISVFAEGLAAFRDGRLEMAQSAFEQVLLQNDLVRRARSHAHLAEIARRQGRLEREQIEVMVRSLDHLGTDSVLQVDAEPLAELWSVCLEYDWFPERFLTLAKASPITSRSDPSRSDPSRSDPSRLDTSRSLEPKPINNEITGRQIMTLHIQALGPLRASVAGQAVHIPFAKAGELLTWLAINGPASRDKIIDIIWDGSNEQRHIEYFKVAVRRLRAALEETAPLEFNPLPFEAGTYRLSERFELHFDVQTLLQALETNLETPEPDSLEPDRLEPDRLKSDRLEPVWTSLENYSGEFLAGIDSEWVLETRRVLLDQALDLAHALGKHLETHDPNAAIRAYKQAIKLESSDVQSYLGLIQNYRNLKQASNAARTFKTYSRILLEHFAEQPDPELVRAFEGHG
jgi:LuxR family transcriptional regulator, maltose regulon positive regulatory protein